MLRFYQKLLSLRRKEIIPRLAGLQETEAGFALIGKAGLHVHWMLAGRKRLEAFINFSDAFISDIPIDGGTILYCLPTVESDHASHVVLAPQSICFLFKDKEPL
jgi:hypothetical protein